MNKEQLTSEGPEQRTEIGFHNLFKLEGKGVEITYGILRLRNEFLDYRDEKRKLTFSAAKGEIDSLESKIGKLITVTLEVVPDSHRLTLTLLLPKINPSGGQGDPFSTLALRTKHFISIGGPDLVKGPLQTYNVLLLNGLATQAD
jgi:hypothetical protein